MKPGQLCTAAWALAALSFLLPQNAVAQDEAAFFHNKQMRMVVGFGPGNDYDLGARLLAKYLPRHIPGQPGMIVQNMPQAASIVAANYMAAQAPRDGTVIGAITRNLPTQALLGQGNVEADPRRLNWLGGTSFPGRVCVVGERAKVKKAEDIFTTELIVGSNGAGNSTNILPTVFNHVLGAKFRLIEGYKGTPDIVLAIERGEVDGVCSSFGQFRGNDEAFSTGRLRVLFRAEEAQMKEIPDAPSIYDFAKSDAQKDFMRFVFSSTEFGRPYVYPPDAPPARIALMRKAIEDAAKDPELVAEAARSQLDMTWREPQHLTELVKKIYDTPPDMIAKVKELIPNMQ